MVYKNNTLISINKITNTIAYASRHF